MKMEPNLNISDSGKEAIDQINPDILAFPWANACRVIKLGMLFLVCYIPFMTVQVLCSVIEKANGFDSLGFYLVGVLYLS